MTAEILDGVDVFPWPLPARHGGQYVGVNVAGILAVHRPTGIAVVVDSERSQHANRKLAVERLRRLVELHERSAA